MAVPSEKYFTINQPEMAEFLRLVRLRKPGFSDWVPSSTIAGWTTVHLPNWEHGAARFYSAIRS